MSPSVLSVLIVLFPCVFGGGRLPPTPSQLVKLDLPGAVCLDGSPATYYYSAGQNTNKFLLHHQGGGWCQTPEECLERSLTDLGSSKGYKSTLDLNSVSDRADRVLNSPNHFTRDPTVNPQFHDWNYVYLPYCDGGSFSGDNTTLVESGTTIYFKGRRIREAVIQSLKESAQLTSASDMVVAGCSAGAAATFFNIDWYAAQVPQAKVRGLPDSGWFMGGDYTRDGKEDYRTRMQNMYDMINATASLSAECTDQHGDKCLFAEDMIKYIKTPMFVVNSKYDASMARGHYGDGQYYDCTDYQVLKFWNQCNTTSVNQFGQFIEASIKAAVTPPHAVFLVSCYRHCGLLTSQLTGFGLGNLTSLTAFQKWYDGGTDALPNNGFVDQDKTFPCPACCWE